MIGEAKQITVPMILSDVAQKAYDEFKSLVLKIFSLLKKNAPENDLKEKFYDSYIDFARKLQSDGYEDESYIYMEICEMYHDLIDSPDLLIENENFFTDLFDSFDKLFFVRKSEPQSYSEKYDAFLLYFSKMQQYYYTKIAVPSPHYNEDVCKEILI